MSTSVNARPFLMYEKGCRDAAEFYATVFPDGKVLSGPQFPGVSFELGGQRFDAYDGGDYFKMSEAFSIQVRCETQAEVDHYWERLVEGGGQHSQCGWLKDRWGVSWQIVPNAYYRLVTDPDPARAQRTMDAMLQMQKLDIAALEAAADGRG